MMLLLDILLLMHTLNLFVHRMYSHKNMNIFLNSFFTYSIFNQN